MVSLYQEARATLRDSHFRPQKKFGQHFLIDSGVIDCILRLGDLSPQDKVLEIGPGLGFVTRRLLDAISELWAVEIDPILAARLRDTLSASGSRLHLIVGDILKVPVDTVLAGKKVKLIANLPYNISTPVLFRLFDFRRFFSTLVLMVQKEVADRMIAVPGTKSYGGLSVGFQVHGHVLERLSVPPEAFFPRPKVSSAILRIVLHADPLVSKEEEGWFRNVVRGAFAQRRKTLSNTLSSSLGFQRDVLSEILKDEGIDPLRRGETLTVDEFLRLARALRHLRP
jgi:16S rRNA (adenine1518-N6/adenine1519-N6)-dimethyltransferase